MQKQILSLAVAATIDQASSLSINAEGSGDMPDDNCCIVWAGTNFMSHNKSFCLPQGADEGRQVAQEISGFRDVWTDGSIKCGKNVDAEVCMDGFELGPLEGQRELGYKCESGSIFVKRGTEVVAEQQLRTIPVKKRGSSIILSLHPWVAKGKQYLGLTR